MSIQQFCLRWNNHQPNFISVFTNMLNNEFLVDVTLAAEGKELHAHKIILSACSVYFQNLFATYPKKHAIVIMKDIKYTDLRIIVDFMYYGEVNVSEEQLADVLDTAKLLKIKGLTEMPESTSVTKSQSMSSERADLLTPGESSWGSDVRRQSLSPCHMSPSMRRKRSASIEKAPDKINADNSVVKNPDMKITLSLNQNQQHLKNKCKESQVSTYHTPRDSLDENGGIGNVVSLHNVDEGPSNFMPRETDLNIEEPSAAHLQQQGHQWTMLEEHGYPRYSTFVCHNNSQTNLEPGNLDNMHAQESDLPINVPSIMSQCEYQTQIPMQTTQIMHKTELCSPGPSCNGLSNNSLEPPALPKRRRHSNPQSEENFQRALEAVRFGGIGFCKAARMFGVNNRTLWLEYKKKGYPNNRPSIRNRIKQEHTSPPPEAREEAIIPQEQQLTLLCPPHSVGMMGFLDSRHVDFTSNIQNINRSRFGDESNIANSPINLHGINFNALQ